MKEKKKEEISSKNKPFTVNVNINQKIINKERKREGIVYKIKWENMHHIDRL